MKARTKKTRWLLITLLFGLLAAAGLTLTLRHRAWIFATANGVATPVPAAVQQPHAPVVASSGAEQVVADPAGTGRHWVVYSADPNSQAPGHVASQSSTAASTDAGSGGHAAAVAGDTSGGTPPQSNHPVTSNTGRLPPNGAELAYNGYAPLDCELPAGCGAPGGGTEYVSRQPSGTSGGVPTLHNSQGSNTGDGSSPPTNGGTTPPGSNPPIASAPELDPATLAAAATLLLGSLAVLRSRRRARASC